LFPVPPVFIPYAAPQRLKAVRFHKAGISVTNRAAAALEKQC